MSHYTRSHIFFKDALPRDSNLSERQENKWIAPSKPGERETEREREKERERERERGRNREGRKKEREREKQRLSERFERFERF